MKGILFALLGGIFITLQGVVNSRMSEHIGTWQTATITQLTGFVAALLFLLFVRDKQWKKLNRVSPIYMCGGALGAIIIFGNITAIHYVGVTLTISVLLIAQLSLTFLIDSKGWFGMVKERMRLPQFIGIGMMIVGVVILRF